MDNKNHLSFLHIGKYIESVANLSSDLNLYYKVDGKLSKLTESEMRMLLIVQKDYAERHDLSTFLPLAYNLNIFVVTEVEKNFRQALSLAFQIGGEYVANKEGKITHRKPRHGAMLGATVKDDLATAAGVACWGDFTTNEQDALTFAYVAGWNAEVDSNN